MKSPHYFIAKPINGRRYDNKKNIDGIDVITSVSEEDHKSSNRNAEVIEVPIGYEGPIKKGYTLLVHHNAPLNARTLRYRTPPPTRPSSLPARSHQRFLFSRGMN